MNVCVIGASNKKERYSYQAVVLLKENGHDVFPVHQRIQEIDGIAVLPSAKDIHVGIDTVTMYVGKAASDVIGDDILSLNPRRIIFNPGSENPELEDKARQEGIDVVHGCTLVMLKTGQF